MRSGHQDQRMDVRGRRRSVRGASARQLRAVRGRIQGESEAAGDVGCQGAGALSRAFTAAAGQGRGTVRQSE